MEPMSSTTIAAIVLLMVACTVIAGICLRRLRRDPSELDEFRAAVAELERTVGDALMPVVQATAGRLARWLERSPRG
jgi:hypothetical protein